MTVPLFSWKYLGPILLKLVDDKRPLVLDLRLNAGGAASAVGQLLAPFTGPDKPFLTAKLANWDSSSCKILYPFDEETNEGNCLDVEAMIENSHAQWRTPEHVPFILKQKIYVLIDKRNYSCGEVFAQAMKEYDCATLVGKTTAGAVVGGRDNYECGHGYRLMLPFVDMVSKDGFVIEGRGVSPHFEMEFTTDDREQLTDEEVRGVIFKSNDFYMDHHA
jgi:C-terminal processing protease CtpA/Prc